MFVKILFYNFWIITDPPIRRALVQIKVLYLLLVYYSKVVPYGLAVRIPGFHPGGPGSTPGMGILLSDFASSDMIRCFMFCFICKFICIILLFYFLYLSSALRLSSFAI